MNRSLVALAALIAWVMLCLPWQVCESDCRTAVVAGWQHDCHLPGTHDGCSGHCHDDAADTPGGDLCRRAHGDGSHSRFVLPLTEPAAEPAFDDQPAPPCFGVCVRAELSGLARRVLARCTGPPGPVGDSLSRLRSVVLLL